LVLGRIRGDRRKSCQPIYSNGSHFRRAVHQQPESLKEKKKKKANFEMDSK
jgi:hypothetical protein